MNDTGNKDAREVPTMGYWIVLATVDDPTRFGNYTSVAGPLIASHGGHVLARGDVSEVVEGAVPGRPYLIEFPSFAAARACFMSESYQKAISLREGVARFQIVIVDGYAPQPSTSR